MQRETNKLCRAVEARRLIGNMPASLVPFRSHWNTVPSQSRGRDWNVPGSRATRKLLLPSHLGLDEYRRSPGGNPKGFLPPLVSLSFLNVCCLGQRGTLCPSLTSSPLPLLSGTGPDCRFLTADKHRPPAQALGLTLWRPGVEAWSVSGS